MTRYQVLREEISINLTNIGEPVYCLYCHTYVVRYHVTRIKSEIIKAQKARKTFGKLNWAIQLSSFLSFCVVFFLQ